MAATGPGRRPPPDPTLGHPGVVTGIGFLGAGVITAGGLSISGLTTTWRRRSGPLLAISIMVGVRLLRLRHHPPRASRPRHDVVSRLEAWLPSRPAVAITSGFRPGFARATMLKRAALDRGYEIAWGTLRIEEREGRQSGISSPSP